MKERRNKVLLNISHVERFVLVISVNSMETFSLEFRHHVALMLSPGVRKADLAVVETYFGKLRRDPEGINLCLHVISNHNKLFDSGSMVLASQIIHQVLKYGGAVVDSSTADRILACTRSVQDAQVYPAAVSTHLLLTIAVILAKDIVQKHILKEASPALWSMVAGIGARLSWASLMRVLSFIPETVKSGRYYTKCNAQQATASMINIYGPLFRDFCGLVPTLLSGSRSDAPRDLLLSNDEMQLLGSVTNWLEVWLEINEVSDGGLSATVASDLALLMSTSLTSRAVDTFSSLLASPSPDSDLENIMNFVGAICEVSACCELGTQTVQQIAPLFCQLLRSCFNCPRDLGEGSRLSVVFRCLPLWLQPLSGTVSSADAGPPWCLVLETMIDAMKCISFGEALEFTYYEPIGSLLLSVLESAVAATGSDGLPPMLIDNTKQLLLGLIQGSMYSPGAMEGEGYQLLLQHRTDMRDFIRELLVLLPGVSGWVLALATEQLRAFELLDPDSAVGTWQEVEAALHCLSACSRRLAADKNALEAITIFVSLLATGKVLNCRPLCVMTVVLVAEFFAIVEARLGPESRLRSLSVVLLSLLHQENPVRVSERRFVWDALPFRTKEDHIGAVSLLKLSKSGYFSSAWSSYSALSCFTPDSAATALKIFRDQPTDVVWSIFESNVHVQPPSVLPVEMLVNMCFFCVLCPSGMKMTWKSTKLAVEGAFSACVVCEGSGASSTEAATFICDRLGPLVCLVVLLVDGNTVSADPLVELLSAVQSSSAAVEMSLSIGQAAVPHRTLTEGFEALSVAVVALQGRLVPADVPLLVLKNLLSPLFSLLLSKFAALTEDECNALCNLIVSCSWVPKGTQALSCTDQIAHGVGRTAQMLLFLLKTQRNCSAIWIRGICKHIEITFACGLTVNPKQVAATYFSEVWGYSCANLLGGAVTAPNITDICSLIEFFTVVVAKLGLVGDSNESLVLVPAALSGILDVMYAVIGHQYENSACDQRKPIWKAMIAFVAVLAGPLAGQAGSAGLSLNQNKSSVDRLAVDQAQGNESWIVRLTGCGVAAQVFDCLLCGLAGGIPTPYRNDIISILQYYFVVLGAAASSQYVSCSLNKYPVSLYVKEKRRPELVKVLYSSSKSDWKRFKDGLKILSRMAKK